MPCRPSGRGGGEGAGRGGEGERLGVCSESMLVPWTIQFIIWKMTVGISGTFRYYSRVASVLWIPCIVLVGTNIMNT